MAFPHFSVDGSRQQASNLVASGQLDMPFTLPRFVLRSFLPMAQHEVCSDLVLNRQAAFKQLACSSAARVDSIIAARATEHLTGPAANNKPGKFGTVPIRSSTCLGLARCDGPLQMAFADSHSAQRDQSDGDKSPVPRYSYSNGLQ
jgi:hypothetical protein